MVFAYMNGIYSAGATEKACKYVTKGYSLANKIKVILVIEPEPKAVATLVLEDVVPAVAINVPSSSIHTEKYGLQAFGYVEFH